MGTLIIRELPAVGRQKAERENVEKKNGGNFYKSGKMPKGKKSKRKISQGKRSKRKISKTEFIE